METTPLTPEPASAAPPPASSLAGRLTNVFAAPGEVFAGIKDAPASVVNWLVPVLIFAGVGVISMCIMFAQPAIQQTIHDQQVKAMDKLVEQGKMNQAQEDQALQAMEKFMGPATLAIIGSVSIVFYSFVSLFGWALVLWLAGRWWLKTPFGYLKAVEVAGLSCLITVLGMVISTLLAVILGRLYAGPSLGLFVGNFDPANRAHLLLGAVNLVNLWHAGVLAVGLAKLSGAPTAKAATAVFGFWVLLELLLIGIGLGQWAL